MPKQKTYMAVTPTEQTGDFTSADRIKEIKMARDIPKGRDIPPVVHTIVTVEVFRDVVLAETEGVFKLGDRFQTTAARAKLLSADVRIVEGDEKKGDKKDEKKKDEAAQSEGSVSDKE